MRTVTSGNTYTEFPESFSGRPETGRTLKRRAKAMKATHLGRRTRRALLVTSVIAAIGAAAAVVLAPTAYAAAGCRVDYRVSSQWPGGFGADVSVTNLGDPVNGWQLTWTFGAGQTIGQVWNATATTSGTTVTVTNQSYNAV